MKRFRAFWRWLLYSDASSYLRYKRAAQGCQWAGEHEENFYGDPFDDPL